MYGICQIKHFQVVNIKSFQTLGQGMMRLKIKKYALNKKLRIMNYETPRTGSAFCVHPPVPNW